MEKKIYQLYLDNKYLLNCYESAYQAAIEHKNNNPEIIHGITYSMGLSPLARDHKEGKLWYHAWVEIGEKIIDSAALPWLISIFEKSKGTLNKPYDSNNFIEKDFYYKYFLPEKYFQRRYHLNEYFRLYRKNGSNFLFASFCFDMIGIAMNYDFSSNNNDYQILDDGSINFLERRK